MNLKFKNYILLNEREHQELLAIRNLEYIRKEMKTKDAIKPSEHLKWVKSLKNSNISIYYAIKQNDEILGGISLIDNHLHSAKWGVFLKTEVNPLISSLSLYAFLEHIFTKYTLDTLELEVDANNTKAYKFDKSFGFKEYNNSVDINNQYIEMYLSKDMWNVQKNKPMFKLLKNKLEKIEFEIMDII